jgi:hypothetical protein
MKHWQSGEVTLPEKTWKKFHSDLIEYVNNFQASNYTEVKNTCDSFVSKCSAASRYDADFRGMWLDLWDKRPDLMEVAEMEVGRAIHDRAYGFNIRKKTFGKLTRNSDSYRIGTLDLKINKDNKTIKWESYSLGCKSPLCSWLLESIKDISSWTLDTGGCVSSGTEDTYSVTHVFNDNPKKYKPFFIFPNAWNYTSMKYLNYLNVAKRDFANIVKPIQALLNFNGNLMMCGTDSNGIVILDHNGKYELPKEITDALTTVLDKVGLGILLSVESGVVTIHKLVNPNNWKHQEDQYSKAKELIKVRNILSIMYPSIYGTSIKLEPVVSTKDKGLDLLQNVKSKIVVTDKNSNTWELNQPILGHDLNSAIYDLVNQLP